MKLSIIVPVYNEEKTIKAVLERLSRLDLGKTKKKLSSSMTPHLILPIKK